MELGGFEDLKINSLEGMETCLFFVGVWIPATDP